MAAMGASRRLIPGPWYYFTVALAHGITGWQTYLP